MAPEPSRISTATNAVFCGTAIIFMLSYVMFNYVHVHSTLKYDFFLNLH